MFDKLLSSFLRNKERIMSMGDPGSHSFAQDLFGRVLISIARIGKVLSGIEQFKDMGTLRDDSFIDTPEGMKWDYNFIADSKDSESDTLFSIRFEIIDGNMESAYFTCKIKNNLVRKVPVSTESLNLKFADSLVKDIRSFYAGVR